MSTDLICQNCGVKFRPADRRGPRRGRKYCSYQCKRMAIRARYNLRRRVRRAAGAYREYDQNYYLKRKRMMRIRLRRSLPFKAAYLIKHQRFWNCPRCNHIFFHKHSSSPLCLPCRREFKKTREAQAKQKEDRAALVNLPDYVIRKYLGVGINVPLELIALKREQIKLERRLRKPHKTNEETKLSPVGA